MIVIRDMVTGDQRPIVDILNQAVRTRRQIAFLEETSLAERQGWFDDHSSPEHPLMVAEEEGRVLGWVSLSAYRPGRAALSATVEVSYGVHESYRRRGVGTAMLTAVLERAREIGHRIVFAIVFDSNTATKRLLEKCGFEKWGHLPDVAELDGVLVGHDYYGIRMV